MFWLTFQFNLNFKVQFQQLDPDPDLATEIKKGRYGSGSSKKCTGETINSFNVIYYEMITK